MKLSSMLLRVCLTIALVFVLVPPIFADELITNGGFETADFTGWMHSDQDGGSGSFFVDSTSLTPLSGGPTVGPNSGAFYALSDQASAGAHVLYQTFTVAPGSTATLSFDMFVNTRADVADSGQLDYTVIPSQYGRVDLLTPTASVFDTGSAVLANYYTGIDTGGLPNPYTHYSFDITPVVGGGGQFMLRFAEVDNEQFFNLGVDDVSVTSDATGATPELPPVALLSALPLGIVWLRRRRAA